MRICPIRRTIGSRGAAGLDAKRAGVSPSIVVIINMYFRLGDKYLLLNELKVKVVSQNIKVIFHCVLF